MPDKSHQLLWRRHLRWLLATILVVLSSTAAVNVLMDPLRIFNAPLWAGLNAKKPYLDHHRELSRLHSALRVCADTGIFGNSRAEIGLDPLSPVFLSQGHVAFNHAIPGSGPRMPYRQLLWLGSAGCAPHNVVLGVDFFDFLGGTAARPLPSLQSDPLPRINLRLLTESVFSVAGLRDSLETLNVQYGQFKKESTAHGFNPLQNYVQEVAQAGHFALFQQRAQENIARWSKKPARLQPSASAQSDDQRVLAATLALAGASGATTRIVIYPYHAQIRIVMARLGLNELFYDWKRQLLALAQQQRALGVDVQVWDFSALSDYTLEPIPKAGDRKTQLAWYWEAGHFKPQLGERMLARMFGKDNAFGVQLAADNLEASIAADRAAMQRLLNQPGDLLHATDQLIASTVKR